ncbi:MAG: hypothetical protein NT062_39365 [Proteobacteria bacterium]|nr:hypothetical protein [Pseudomonadota bacterium]
MLEQQKLSAPTVTVTADLGDREEVQLQQLPGLELVDQTGRRITTDDSGAIDPDLIPDDDLAIPRAPVLPADDGDVGGDDDVDHSVPSAPSAPMEDHPTTRWNLVAPAATKKMKTITIPSRGAREPRAWTPVAGIPVPPAIGRTPTPSRVRDESPTIPRPITGPPMPRPVTGPPLPPLDDELAPIAAIPSDAVPRLPPATALANLDTAPLEMVNQKTVPLPRIVVGPDAGHDTTAAANAPTAPLILPLIAEPSRPTTIPEDVDTIEPDLDRPPTSPLTRYRLPVAVGGMLLLVVILYAATRGGDRPQVAAREVLVRDAAVVAVLPIDAAAPLDAMVPPDARVVLAPPDAAVVVPQPPPRWTKASLVKLYEATQYGNLVTQCAAGGVNADASICVMAACRAGNAPRAKQWYALTPARRRAALLTTCLTLGVHVDGSQTTPSSD